MAAADSTSAPRLERSGAVTLAELAVTISILGALGLVASRVGLSAIPAYLLAGLLLGPNEPKVLNVVNPSEVTEFLANLGLVFLLFFLGLEFSPGRLLRSGRHLALGGTIDLVANGLLGLAIGLIAFGPGLAALLLAGAIYVSSSAITVKGLIDFRRLADDEVSLILGILLFEDLVIAFVLALAAGGGGGVAETLALVGKAIGFIAASLLASRILSKPIDRLLDRLSREFFLLATFAFVVGMAAIAHELGLSEAIGALMAGVVLAETSVREDIEERFFSFRDLFGALFFFVFGLSIDVGSLDRVWWLLLVAVPASVIVKTAGGYVAGLVGGFSRRMSFNTGVALVAHGEFTVIIAQLAAANDVVTGSAQEKLIAFSGMYVLLTATLGIVLMKESKVLGRMLFRTPARTTLESS
jgi:CPA2 family monovalent cation:H+ antiporter-2